MHIIFQFEKDSDISSWEVISDFVMGGVSRGDFNINKYGKGVFFGNISLENNGGFSLLRFQFEKIHITHFTKIIFKVKGDNKNYQFRIKDSVKNSHSYVNSVATSLDWELIEICLKDFEPAFRGKKLSMNNFSSDYIEEVAILIGNNKAQNFKLEIDKIYLE